MLASCNSSTNPFISDPKVTFQNKSTTNNTYNVVWDGTNVGTISPGGSKTITSKAGTHVLQFKFASNNADIVMPAFTIASAVENPWSAPARTNHSEKKAPMTTRSPRAAKALPYDNASRGFERAAENPSTKPANGELGGAELDMRPP